MRKTNYITRKDAAEILGVSPQTITNWHEEGRVPGEYRGKILFLSREAVNKLNEALNNYQINKDWIKSLEDQQKEVIKELTNAIEDYKTTIGIVKGETNENLKLSLLLAALKTRDDYFSEREIYVVQDVLNGYSFNEIGERMELTRERVRQIFEKSLRKIRDFLNYETIYEENKRLSSEIASLKSIKELIEVKRKEVEPTIFELLNKDIKELDISVRCKNCLYFSGIKNLMDLLKLGRREFLKLRNVGKKSLTEIEDFLEAHGLSFETNLNDLLIANSDISSE